MTASSFLLALVTLVGRIGAVDISSAAKALVRANKDNLRSATIEDFSYILSISRALNMTLALSEQEICQKLKQDFSSLKHPSLDDCFFVVSAHHMLSNYCQLDWIQDHLRKLNAPALSSPKELYRYLYATADFREVRKVSANQAKESLERLTTQRLSDSNLGYCLLVGKLILPEVTSATGFFESLLKSAIARLSLLPTRMDPIEPSEDESVLMSGVLQLDQLLSTTSSSSFLDKGSIGVMINFVEQSRRPATGLIRDLVDIAERLCSPQVFAIYGKVPVKIALIHESHGSRLFVDARDPRMYISIRSIIGRPVDAMLELVSLTGVGQDRHSISLNKKFEPKDSTRTVHFVSLADSEIPIGSYVATIKVKLDKDPASTQTELIPVDFKTAVEVSSVSVKISSGPGNQETVTLGKNDQLPQDTVLLRDQDMEIRVELGSSGSENMLPKLANSFICFEPKIDEQLAFGEVIKHFETCFTPSQQSDLQHRFLITGPSLSARLMSLSGTYTIRFIAHHPLLLRSAEFNLGQVKINYKRRQDFSFASIFKPRKALISHTFAQPEARAPFVVSAMFSGISAALLFSLLPLWKYVGANFSKCPLSFSVPLYHLVHGASIAALCYCWAVKDMFFTIKAVVVLYAVLFLLGRRVVISTLKKE